VVLPPLQFPGQGRPVSSPFDTFSERTHPPFPRSLFRHVLEAARRRVNYAIDLAGGSLRLIWISAPWAKNRLFWRFSP